MSPPSLLLLLTVGVTFGTGQKLLKVPRIYNALITSDEELVPSQAYPAVAPVLRPAPSLYLSQPQQPLGGPPAPRSPSASGVSTPLQPPSLRGLSTPVEGGDVSWDVVKNNRPSDPAIPDVAPPPIPVAFKSTAGRREGDSTYK